MKTFLRLFFFSAFIITLSQNAQAFQYRIDDHMEVSYQYCGRDVFVKFVYFQSEGDNDRMLYLKLMHRPSGGGSDQMVIDFRHLNHWPDNETGLDTIPDPWGIQDYAYKFNGSPWNFTPVFIQNYRDPAQDDQGAIKYYVEFLLKDLPSTFQESFFFSGLWDCNGSACDDQPNDGDITFGSGNTLRSITIANPAAPSGLTASVGQCGQITLNWTNNETRNCSGDYFYRIFREDLFLANIPADINMGTASYSDYIAPIGTTLAPNQYDYKVQLILFDENFELVQTSNFAGPTTGSVLPLPLAPTNVSVSYPNCTGSYQLTWQNNGLYDSVKVAITPSGGATVIHRLAGSTTSRNGTINPGTTYSAVVIGQDVCGQQNASSPALTLVVPTGPGPFTQNAPVLHADGILISWTLSSGATSYKITRTGDGSKEYTINDPAATSFVDSDVKVCTQYAYKVTAVNNCGSVSSQTLNAPIVPQSLNIWTAQKLRGSKGYFGNRVELKWDAPNSQGFNHYKMYRKPLGTSELEFVAVVDKNDLLFNDLYALPGVLYEYHLVAFSECNGQAEETDPLIDIGFRLPIAIVSGNVKFENGTGVEGVEVTVERNAGNLGKGLYFDGQGVMTVHPTYADVAIDVLSLIPQMTLEFWLKPENLSSSFSVFNYVNGNTSYGLYYDASEEAFIQYFSNDVNARANKYQVSLSEDYFTHISWARNQLNLFLFLDGVSVPGDVIGYVSPGGITPLTFGSEFNGYLDEIRFWDKRRLLAEIQADYQQILRGDEENLIAYWRIDEGVGTGVYDISGKNNVFNANHLQINNHVSWVNEYPDGNQLGYISHTDSVGNYTVKNIRYTDNGNTFTVIPYFNPGGTPHQFDPASTVLFLGEGSNIQNNVNFVDKSSFLVTGGIKYSLPDSMCDNTKAFIYIDDRIAQVNGQPVFVDPMTRTFAIHVPIGLHRISVVQGGHVFHNSGMWPPDGSLYDFQKDESGLEFFDSTRVRLIGRVVGGTREGNKKLGFDESVNNIGIAAITFTSQIFDCHEVTVFTDSTSGEYSVDLLPVKYDVTIDVLNNAEVDFGTLDVLDLTAIRPPSYVLDTTFNPGGQPLFVDSVLYNLQQNYIYRSLPSLDLVQLRDSMPLQGDSVFYYVRPETMDTTIVPLDDLIFPAFVAGKKYETLITAFEPYFNYDIALDTLEDRVPVTDGKLTIRNGLGNELGSGIEYDEVIDLMSEDGSVLYAFIGGQPEFIMDGSQSEEFSFTKTFEIRLETPDRVVTWLPDGDLYRGYVLGSKPVDGSSFITEGPELVDFILRDPPGDGSFSSFVHGETYTDTKSWFTNIGGSFSTEIKIKTGAEWLTGGGLAGIGFTTTTTTSLLTNFSIGFQMSEEGELTEVFTFEEGVSTNGDGYFTGAPMDLYVGKSTNYLFGKAEELTFIDTSFCDIADLCFGPVIPVGNSGYQLAKRRGMFMVPDGFSTSFIYSQFHIEFYLIPNLEGLRNHLFIDHPDLYQSYLNNGDPGFGLNNDDPFWGDDASSTDPLKTEPADEDGPSYRFTPPPGNTVRDEIRWFNQQIRLWQDAMAANEREKVFAVTEENISFDARATLDRSVSYESSETKTVKFELSSAFDFGLFIDGESGGTGSNAKFLLGVQIAGGAGITDQFQESNTYAFHLEDGQPGDFFSIDIKNGKKGNGPIFSLRGGQSMCPWEQGEVTQYYNPGTELSVSTIRRELPDIDVEPSIQANVPEHQPARFQIKMRNASPTGEIQWYGLRIIEQTNPFGAVLKIDGFSPNRVFEVPAGETIEKTLELYKSESNDYEIKLMLYSTCEYEGFQNGATIYSTDTITISAHFVPACSPVSVHKPVDLWISNVDDNHMIEIQLDDYLIDDPGLENLQLQYKPSFTSVWKGIETLWKTVPMGVDDPQIPPGSNLLTYLWDVEELPDGPYDIRAVSHCTNTDNDYASPHVSGIIDRVRPHAFGNPQPADGVLDPNDEILIQFNEIINPASVITSDFDIRAVLNGAPLRHETSIELDGVNDYVEIPTGTRLGDHAFTIEVWVKRLSNGAQLIWSQGEEVDSSMALGFNPSNKLFFRMYNSTIISDAIVLADGLWHHIAVTCNENLQVNFYLTGQYYQGGFIADLVSIPGNMVFGKQAWSDAFFFHGYMHEARIWRTELTEGIIRAQMLKKLSGAEAGLSTLWPMDDGMGTVLREVVRKKNAALHGNWAILPSGKSLVFDGASLLDVTAGSMVFSHQHDFTLEFWINGAKNGGVQTILSNGKGDGTDANASGWSVSADAVGKLIIFHGGQSSIGITKDILDNNWHHVAIVLSRRGNLNCYLDGTLQSSIFGEALGEFAGASLWVGARGWYNGIVEEHDQYFEGALDEVRVWNSRLTAELIKASMLNRLAGDEFGLQLYLPFESYSEVGGIPILTQTLNDLSPFMRLVSIEGAPQYQEEDPNIKLVAPFEKVNFTFSINGDRILITPTTDPLRLERTVLYISLKGVQDIHGNDMASPVNWTAFVNKNQLQWTEDELFFDKPEKEALQFTTEISNSGGIELSFEILGLPDWLTATPSVGTISPVSTRQIMFEISPNVNIGDYSADINLLSGQGYNDKLAINLHVFGVPPAWNIDPASYAHTMNVVADLDIFGELSDDPLDRVVAYVNGEVRGLTTLQYIPELDRYLGFLEVYSNVTSGEQVTFKVWDASTGTTYAGVNIKVGTQQNAQIPFVANTLVGNAVSPARWIVTPDIIQEIPLNAGWTWISFNVLSSKFGNLDAFFAELNFENGDKVLSQTKEATYNPSSGWQGNLLNPGLEIKKMYKCDFTYADVLRVSGPRVNPTLYPINIVAGWNWIPYLSSEPIEINEALSSFNPTAGDQMKSQDQFAVYHPTQGWVGTLKYMEPGKGYMLFADNAGTLIYPLRAEENSPEISPIYAERTKLEWRSGREHQPLLYRARNMTMIATLESEMPIDELPLIAAFAGDQLLQVCTPIQIAGSNRWSYYFTLQGDESDDVVHFEVYHADGGYAGLAEERIDWDADLMIGTLNEPFVLHLRKPVELFFNAQPNPFSQALEIQLEMPEAGNVEIAVFDIKGTLAYATKLSVPKAGLHKLVWDGRSPGGDPISSGVYILQVRYAGSTHYEKLMKH